jgi:hypothetical protein
LSNPSKRVRRTAAGKKAASPSPLPKSSPKSQRDSCPVPQHVPKPLEEVYRPRVIVKFYDYIQLPYKDGVEKEVQERKIGSWDLVEQEFPGSTLKRLFTCVAPEKIVELT